MMMMMMMMMMNDDDDDPMLHQVVNDGGMPALVSLACCGEGNAQRQALTAMRGLCISPEFRALAVREGILDPLILMARSDEVAYVDFDVGVDDDHRQRHQHRRSHQHQHFLGNHLLLLLLPRSS
jgi:hypothetical protein